MHFQPEHRWPCSSLLRVLYSLHSRWPNCAAWKAPSQKAALVLDCSSSLECQYMSWMLHNGKILNNSFFKKKKNKELNKTFCCICCSVKYYCKYYRWFGNFKYSTCLSNEDPILELWWVNFIATDKNITYIYNTITKKLIDSM